MARDNGYAAAQRAYDAQMPDDEPDDEDPTYNGPLCGLHRLPTDSAGFCSRCNEDIDLYSDIDHDY